MPWNQCAFWCGRLSGLSAPMKTGVSDLQISAVRSAFRVACLRSTLPATVVKPRTFTLGSASAMMIATASSEAVSVSMRKLRMGLQFLAPVQAARVRPNSAGEHRPRHVGLARPIAAELRNQCRRYRRRAGGRRCGGPARRQFGGARKILRAGRTQALAVATPSKLTTGLPHRAHVPRLSRGRRTVAAELNSRDRLAPRRAGPERGHVGERHAVSLLADRAMAKKAANRIASDAETRSAAETGAILVHRYAVARRRLKPRSRSSFRSSMSSRPALKRTIGPPGLKSVAVRVAVQSTGTARLS